MGAHGAALVPDDARILTHCNAGALATAGYGTALGVIRAAAEQGKRVAVLRRRDAPVPAGRAPDRVGAGEGRHRHHRHHRQHGRRDDAARPASTWSSSAPTASPPTATSPTRSAPTAVAVLAKEHGIPFYVAAPLSTIDLDTPDGSGIPIEERNDREVTHVGRGTPDAGGRAHPQPGLRRHAGAVRDRHHHRARHRPARRTRSRWPRSSGRTSLQARNRSEPELPA